MNIIAKYKILPDLRLIIEVFCGNISFEDAIEMKKREIQDKDYNPNFNFIVSTVDVDISFDEKLVRKYIDIIKDNPKIIGKRRSALITATPTQVAMTILYELALKDLPMNFKIVSTLQAAIEWVGLSKVHESVIIENIELLKNSTN
jgi:hypothetical protein